MTVTEEWRCGTGPVDSRESGNDGRGRECRPGPGVTGRMGMAGSVGNGNGFPLFAGMTLVWTPGLSDGAGRIRGFAGDGVGWENGLAGGGGWIPAFAGMTLVWTPGLSDGARRIRGFAGDGVGWVNGLAGGGGWIPAFAGMTAGRGWRDGWVWWVGWEWGWIPAFGGMMG